MQATDLLAPLLLATAGVVMIGGLVVLTASALAERGIVRKRSWTLSPSGFRMRRRMRLLDTADECIRQERYPEAVQALKDSLLLNQLRPPTVSSEEVYLYHLSVLSRYVTIGELRKRQLDTLPLLEGLFLSRSEMTKSYDEVLRNRRWDPDGEVPAQLEELREKLETNRKNILSQIDLLAERLLKVDDTQGVTYH
jgi:hypothetical protein